MDTAALPHRIEELEHALAQERERSSQLALELAACLAMAEGRAAPWLTSETFRATYALREEVEELRRLVDTLSEARRIEAARRASLEEQVQAFRDHELAVASALEVVEQYGSFKTPGPRDEVLETLKDWQRRLTELSSREGSAALDLLDTTQKLQSVLPQVESIRAMLDPRPGETLVDALFREHIDYNKLLRELADVSHTLHAGDSEEALAAAQRVMADIDLARLELRDACLDLSDGSDGSALTAESETLLETARRLRRRVNQLRDSVVLSQDAPALREALQPRPGETLLEAAQRLSADLKRCRERNEHQAAMLRASCRWVPIAERAPVLSNRVITWANDMWHLWQPGGDHAAAVLHASHWLEIRGPAEEQKS